MKNEQNENPDFKSIVADLSKAPNPRYLYFFYASKTV